LVSPLKRIVLFAMISIVYDPHKNCPANWKEFDFSMNHFPA